MSLFKSNFRVKKPNEFNRPSIPISKRIVARNANSYVSKKVRILFLMLNN